MFKKVFLCRKCHVEPSYCLLATLSCSNDTKKRDVLCLVEGKHEIIKVNYKWAFEGHHKADVALSEKEFDNPDAVFPTHLSLFFLKMNKKVFLKVLQSVVSFLLSASSVALMCLSFLWSAKSWLNTPTPRTEGTMHTQREVSIKDST